MATAAQDSVGLWKTRYTMALLSLLGLSISLATRVNISVAIVDMVNETAVREREANGSNRTFYDPDACPGELALSRPGGRKGGIVPTIQSLICRWSPDHERSKFSIIFLGQYVGTVVSMAATGSLCATALGWPLTFHVFGGIGLLWCLPWWILVADSPAQHKTINPAERRYIEATIFSSAKQKLPVPWRSLLTAPAVWALVAFLFTIDISFYLLLSSVPLYIADILHFDVQSNGILSAAPHIAGGVGNLLFGWLIDFIFRRGYVSKITGFRVINSIGLLGPAAALVVVALPGCNTAVIVAMLAFSGFCMASHCSAFYMNMQAIAPNYAGTIVGVVNTFGSMSGIIVPYVVGAFTNANSTRATWNMVFYMAAAVAAAGYVLYAVFTTAEEQPWNAPPTENGTSRENDKGVTNTAFGDDD